MRLLVTFCVLLLFCSHSGLGQDFSKFEPDSVSTAGNKFLVYLPPGYDPQNDYPLLVSLHGAGVIGDALEKLLIGGEQAPSQLIHDNRWPASRPFIVLSPLLERDLSVPNFWDQEWPPDVVDEVIEYVKSGYSVDNDRIYFTGLSLGGAGVWDYAVNYPEKVAAISPISGVTDTLDACSLINIPVWAFHGSQDYSVPTRFSRDMVRKIKECSPGLFTPKLSLIQGRQHDIWGNVWDGLFRFDVFDWMLKFTNNSAANVSPYVKIDHYKKVAARSDEFYIYADFFDWDGDIASAQWTQEGGPNLTFSSVDGHFLRIESLPAGSYKFKITVTDNLAASTEKSIDLEVVAGPGPGDPAVLGMMLIDGSTDQDLFSIEESQVINKAVLNVDEFNFRAIANGNTQSVRFTVNGDSNTWKDNAPFLLVRPRADPEWQMDPGDYSVCMTPYSFEWGAGVAGINQCFRISVYDQPLIHYYAKPGTDLSLLNSWGTEIDGSGDPPDSLTGNFVVFNVENQNQISNPVVIDGIGSEIIVKSGGQVTIQSDFSGIISTEDNATVNVTSNQLIETGTIHPNSTFTFSGSASTIPVTTFGHLTFSGTGVMNLGSGETVVAGNLVSNGVELRGVSGNQSTLKVSGNVTINGLVESSGDTRITLEFDNSSSAQTLSIDSDLSLHQMRAGNNADVLLSSGIFPTLRLGTSSGGGLEIQTSGILDLSNCRIELEGTATINSLGQTGQLGLEDSELLVSTTSTQNSNLYPKPSSRGLDKLEINTPAGTELVLQGAIDIKNYISVSQGTINSNGFIRLLSSGDNSSAYVKPLGAGSQITGNVVVQRYMSGEGRIWRYISAPVSGSTVAQLQNYIPVTGEFSGSSTGMGLTSLPSMYYYDEDVGLNEMGWLPFPAPESTSQEQIVAGRGYSVFVREDTEPTVFELSGNLNQGDIVFTLTDGSASSSDGWNLIGNPYSSPIQWDPIGLTGWTMSGVSPSIHVRDNASGIWMVWDGDTGNLTDGYIAPGQSFWVQTSTLSPGLTISETAKYDSRNSTFYRKDKKVDYLKLSLSDGEIEDFSFVKFEAGATDLYLKQEDTFKKLNTSVNLATLSEDSISLSINAIGEIVCEKNILIGLNHTKPGDYSLNIDLSNIGQEDVHIELHDRYLKKQVHHVNPYNFQISIDSATYLNRFTLRIKKEPADSGELHYSIDCHEGLNVLTIEASVVGFDYRVVYEDSSRSDIFKGTGQDLAIVLDTGKLSRGVYPAEIRAEFPACGSYQSMAVALENHNLSECEQIITGLPVFKDQSVSIYPNPVDRYSFTIAGELADSMQLSIYSAKGLLIESRQVTGSNGETLEIELPENIPPGLYFLRILNAEKQHIANFIVR